MKVKPFQERTSLYGVAWHESGKYIITDETGRPCSLEQITELRRILNECVPQWTQEELDVAEEERREAELEYERQLSLRRAVLRKPIPGHVYLLRFDSGIYKIGRSIDLENRMGNYLSHNASPPVLVCWIEVDDPLQLEKLLHEKFSSKRVKGKEWFRLTPDDVEFIVKLAETKGKL